MPVCSLMIQGNNHLCRGFTCSEVLLQDKLQARYLPAINPRGKHCLYQTIGLFIMLDREFWSHVQVTWQVKTGGSART